MRARTWAAAATAVTATLGLSTAANAAWTSTAPVAVAGDAGSLATPGAPHAVVSGGNVNLDWTAPTGTVPPAGWQVLRGAALVCTVPAATTNCTETAAPTGAPLTYRVRGTVDSWLSPTSPASDAVTVPVPTSLKAPKPVADNPARAVEPPAPEPKPATTPITEKADPPAPPPVEEAEPPAPPATTEVEPSPQTPLVDPSPVP